MFYSIKNLVDQHVRPVEKPWEIVNNSPYGMKKAEYRKWSKQPTTDHHWISLCQGVSENVRIGLSGTENPVFEAHGIVADYDAPMPDGFAEHTKAHPASEHMPQWKRDLVELKSRTPGTRHHKRHHCHKHGIVRCKPDGSVVAYSRFGTVTIDGTGIHITASSRSITEVA